METNSSTTADQNMPEANASGLQAKICLGIALAIVAAGITITTGIFEWFGTLVQAAASAPMVVSTIIAVIASAATIVYLFVKFSLARHLFGHAFGLSFFAALFYFLAIEPNYDGATHLSFSGLALIEFGGFVLAACLARHGNHGIEGFSHLFGMFQFVFLMILSCASPVFLAHSDRRLRLEGVNHYLSLNSDHSEKFVLKGAKFRCWKTPSGDPECEFGK